MFHADHIEYLEEQLPKLDRFRREPLQLTFEFYDGKWLCYYGWYEAYDGLYQLDFLRRYGSVLKDVLEALVRDTEKCIAVIDEFLIDHKLYRFGSDPNKAIHAQLVEEGIETHEVTDIQEGTYHATIKWRRDTYKCSGGRKDLEQFWVRK